MTSGNTLAIQALLVIHIHWNKYTVYSGQFLPGHCSNSDISTCFSFKPLGSTFSHVTHPVGRHVPYHVTHVATGGVTRHALWHATRHFFWRDTWPHVTSTWHARWPRRHAVSHSLYRQMLLTGRRACSTARRAAAAHPWCSTTSTQGRCWHPARGSLSENTNQDRNKSNLSSSLEAPKGVL